MLFWIIFLINMITSIPTNIFYVINILANKKCFNKILKKEK
uniref:7TM_GPCR_Srx domain-containing protein n=1 Tax=Heterorhabditis bacteriophora TaxID=37862 RepID=A0A1I7X568_HETBA